MVAGVACGAVLESVGAAPLALCALAAVEASNSEADKPTAVQRLPSRTERTDCDCERKSVCVKRPIGGVDGN